MNPSRLPAVLGLCLASALPSCASVRPRPVPVHRAVWVTRWDYVTKDKSGVGSVTRERIAEIMRNCSQAGFDTVLFQVRGNATALYESPFEPWSEDLGWKSPGLDPLRTACDEARANGLSIHAWVNAMPAWRGDKAPTDHTQLWHSRPHWFLLDQDGKRQALKKDYYVIINPCLPPVRQYLGEVCADIVQRYPVQGIHLDYIRFLEPESGKDFSHDPWTMEIFHEMSGKRPQEAPEDWHEFKVASVTNVVRTVREQVKAVRPDCLVTAAVFRDFESARATVMQDAPHWLSKGWVDAVFPMAYDKDDDRFARTVRREVQLAGDYPVIAGIGAYMHPSGDQTSRQMEIARLARAQGVAVFGYSSLFAPASAPATAKRDDAEARARESRRQAVEAWFDLSSR